MLIKKKQLSEFSQFIVVVDHIALLITRLLSGDYLRRKLLMTFSVKAFLTLLQGRRISLMQ